MAERLTRSDEAHFQSLILLKEKAGFKPKFNSLLRISLYSLSQRLFEEIVITFAYQLRSPMPVYAETDGNQLVFLEENLSK